MTAERIQKILARAGYGSRREIERWIVSGLIEVNGKTAQLGDRIEVTDSIKLRGETISIRQSVDFKRRILAYHKPAGEIVSRDDPEGRASVFDSLPQMKTSRWIAVGRLDLNTSGLLLLTNDGELANRLMHPSSEVEREYAVRILGEVSESALDNLRKGVQLDDGMARFEDIQSRGNVGAANQWFHVLLKEGKNREVRRLWESQGVVVSRLMRVRYGSIALQKGLRPGRWQELDSKASASLYRLVGMQAPRFQPAKKAASGSPWAGRKRRSGRDWR